MPEILDPRPPERADTVAFLGLGAMGRALAAATLSAGRATVVRNRTDGRADDLVRDGAHEAGSTREAVTAAGVVVLCLLDHRSVHDVLEPVADALAGRTLVDVTTTTPEESRELAAWAASHGATLVEGGIMAVPAMIGGPGAEVLYSGSREAFDSVLPVLEPWGESSWLGEDPGLASLHDLALLAGMTAMFAGFFHGVAMVGTAGVSAGDFVRRAVPWFTAMTAMLPEYAEVIDAPAYDRPGQQGLDFWDLSVSDMVRASEEAGLATDVLDAVQALVRRQVDAGHGADGFPRVVESIRGRRSAGFATTAPATVGGAA